MQYNFDDSNLITLTSRSIDVIYTTMLFTQNVSVALKLEGEGEEHKLNSHICYFEMIYFHTVFPTTSVCDDKSVPTFLSCSTISMTQT